MANPISNFLSKQGGGMFISFARENPITGTYMGAAEEKNPYGGGIRMVYVLKMKDGTTKKLASVSKRLANQFLNKNVQEGDLITIKQFGEKFETYYAIDVLETPKRRVKGEPEEDDSIYPEEDPEQIDSDGVPIPTEEAEKGSVDPMEF